MGAHDDLMSDGRGSSYIAGRMDAVMALSMKTLTYQSRACAEERVSIKQDSESGMWGLDQEEARLMEALAICYQENPRASQRELASMLAERIGKWKGEDMTLEGARGHVRRKLAGIKTGGLKK
jgi:hypothetical protein